MGYFFEDVGSLGCPDEGLWILNVDIDVASDRHDELFEVPKVAASEPVFGSGCERIARSC